MPVQQPQLPPGTRGAGRVRRILVIDVTTPRPDRDSGSQRAYQLLQLLRDMGYAVDFLPDDRRDAGRYSDAVRALGIALHTGARIGAYPRWLAAHARRYDAFVISRYHLGEFLLPLLRRLAPNALLILDTVDLHHLRESRAAELHNDHRLRRLAQGTRRRELSAIAMADVTWVVSTAERDLLGQALPDARVVVLPNIHAVAQNPIGFDARAGLLFLGGARHPPNVDAARWLLSEVYPQIEARLPGCVLHLVGEGMAQALPGLQIATTVHMHGYLPDIEPLLASTRIGLAPLRFGAGVKGKINTYMAAGMPVVATTCAAEGMYLHDGIDVVLADDTTAFADAVARLYCDPARWRRLALAGLDNVRGHFSAAVARTAIDATFCREA